MKSRRGHLLFRIFFTYLLTALLILSVVGLLFFSLHSDRKLPQILENNFNAYLQMLHYRIHNDSSPDSLVKIKMELGLMVRTDQQAELANKEGLPSFDEIFKQDDGHFSNIQFGRYRGFFFATNPQLQPRTIWFLPVNRLPERFRFTFLSIAIVLVSILAMSFLTIRWMMSPIKALLEGVENIARGNLKFRIETDCKNEFEVISAAFNRMASRLEDMINAKERLLRDVSHELRSPLTRINVASSLLENDKLKDQIKSDVKKMDQLINEVLETYRIRDESFRIQLSEINLKEFFELIVNDYQDDPIRVELNQPIPATLKWNIDPLHFERVIRNLIENAIKYSEANKVTLQIRQLDNHLEIQVIDKGRGITELELAHIFEPFYRVDAARTPDRNGYGLGLAICKAIIEAHKGSIKVSSTTGIGTTFTIQI
jgi:signal transduction histidine kinase